LTIFEPKIRLILLDIFCFDFSNCGVKEAHRELEIVSKKLFDFSSNKLSVEELLE